MFFHGFEYSADGKWKNEPNATIDFTDDFYKFFPVPTDVSGYVHYVTMSRANCRQNNGFNSAQPETNAIYINTHNGFEMGQLILSNCIKNDDGTFTVRDGGKPEIQYNLQQDINALPQIWNGNNVFENPLLQHSRISDDSYNGTVSGLAFLNNKRIGFGGWYYLGEIYRRFNLSGRRYRLFQESNKR